MRPSDTFLRRGMRRRKGPRLAAVADHIASLDSDRPLSQSVPSPLMCQSILSRCSRKKQTPPGREQT
jgi:hypothetical protein